MRTILGILVCVMVMLVGVEAQQPAGRASGSIFSIPATGATVLITNSSSGVFRWIQLDTNSPAGLLCMGLQPGYTATNTYTTTKSVVISTGVVTTNVFTNTVSWVTLTNALTTAAAGEAQSVGGGFFFRMNPGDYYSFDSVMFFQGTVIGVSVDGTNRATGVTGEGNH